MSSNNSQKTITVNTFREELDHMITNIIAKVEESHKRCGVVATSREDLHRYIGQQMIPETYIVEPNMMNAVAGLGPMFVKLPRELRDMIFGLTLASGYPQFLRASKIMNKEGTSLISKYGVYRINIGLLTRQVANIVQNLHLRVKMREYSPFDFGTDLFEPLPEKEILEMFGNSETSRKSCTVSFEARRNSKARIYVDVLVF